MAEETEQPLVVRKSSPTALTGVALVAFALGAGAGWFGAEHLSPAAEAAEIADSGAPAAATSTSVVDLGSFTVNLRGAGGSRLLRLQVEVEVDAPDTTVIEERKAVLRDAVITLASDYTYEELEGLDGKMRLRDELFARLGAVLDRADIQHVYFTEFVVQ